MTSLFTQSQPQSSQQGAALTTIRRKVSSHSQHPTSGNGNHSHHHRNTPWLSSFLGRSRSSQAHRHATTSTTTKPQEQRRIIPQCMVWGCITMLCFQCLTLVPILFYETQTPKTQQKSSSVIQNNNHLQKQPQPFVLKTTKRTLSQYPTKSTKDHRVIPQFEMSDLASLYNDENDAGSSLPLLRGIQQEIYFSSLSTTTASLPIPPALMGAQRAQIQCPNLNVNRLAYWNDPIGTRDLQYQSPFHVFADHDNNENKQAPEMYISFAPDPGGWNNIRMSMEIIFVLAAATGRTLILPPKEPLYLLQHDTKQKHRGFADFFPIHTEAFQKIVKTITFEEFLNKEGKEGPLSVNALLLQQQQQQQEGNHLNTTTTATIIPTLEQLLSTADHCDKRQASLTNCRYVYTY